MADERILAIDDDPELLEFLKETLTNAGYSVAGAETGKKALEALRTFKPDLVLLDLMLPDMDGLEVCKKMRADSEFSTIPILMLTARKTVEDKVAGLELGADFYLPKPFESRELLAQIQSTFRRVAFSSNILRKGPIEINPQYNRVKVGDKEISELTSREFNLLYALMEASPRSVSRSELYKKIWEEGEYPDTTRRIDMMVQRLRHKLGEKASSYIKTVEGVGYKFEK